MTLIVHPLTAFEPTLKEMREAELELTKELKGKLNYIVDPEGKAFLF